MNKAGYCLFVSDIPAAFKTCFIYLFTFQTSLLLFYKLHKVWMSNLPSQGGNNFRNIKFNVNPNKSLALQVKMCENNCPCNIFTSGDRFWNKKLITWSSRNLFQPLAQISELWFLLLGDFLVLQMRWLWLHGRSQTKEEQTKNQRRLRMKWERRRSRKSNGAELLNVTKGKY